MRQVYSFASDLDRTRTNIPPFSSPRRTPTMTTYRTISLVAAILVLAVASPSLAQRSPAKPAPKKAAPESKPVPFDTMSSTVTKQMFSSARAVIDKHTVRERGQYETTEEFRARQRAVVDGTVYAVPFTGACAPEFEYDADAGKMSVSVSRSGIYRVFDSTGGYIPSTCWDVDKGSYAASNAFGARTVVDESEYRSLGFQVNENVGSLERISWALPRDRARTLHPHLAAFLVVRPSLPATGKLVEAARSGISATFDRPSSSSLFSTALHSDLLALWVYDRRTGEVATKFNLLGRPEVSPASRLSNMSDAVYDASNVGIAASISDTSRREMGRLLDAAYPQSLRDAGTEGQAVVRFIVDPDGTVRRNSVEVRSATHPEFKDASVQVMLGMRFNPARVGDKKVPMLLELPLTWRIPR